MKHNCLLLKGVVMFFQKRTFSLLLFCSTYLYSMPLAYAEEEVSHKLVSDEEFAGRSTTKEVNYLSEVKGWGKRSYIEKHRKYSTEVTSGSQNFIDQTFSSFYYTSGYYFYKVYTALLDYSCSGKYHPLRSATYYPRLGSALKNTATVGVIKNSIFKNTTIETPCGPQDHRKGDNGSNWHAAPYLWGGALYNLGTVHSIEDTIFSGNWAELTFIAYNRNDDTMGKYDSAYGGADVGSSRYLAYGAIANEASGTIEKISNVSILSNRGENLGYSYAVGGAILNEGKIGTLENSTISANAALSLNLNAAGVVYNKGSFNLITDSSFTNNTVKGRVEVAGGGIYNSGTISQISGGTFSGNLLAHYNSSYTGGTTNYVVTIGGDVVSELKAAGGAIHNTGTIGNWGSKTIFRANTLSDTYYALGGGIYNSGTLNSVNAYFNANKAVSLHISLGGGFYNVGTVKGTVTANFYQNHAEFSGAASYLLAGGGLFNAGTMAAVNANFQENLLAAPYILADQKVFIGGAGLYNEGYISSLGVTTLDQEGYQGFYNNKFWFGPNDDAHFDKLTGVGLYNNEDGTIQSINGVSFRSNNFVDAASVSTQYTVDLVGGGGFHNLGTVGSLNNTTGATSGGLTGGSFLYNQISNKADREGAKAYGAGLLNEGNLYNLSATFTGNKITSAWEAQGGGLWNGQLVWKMSGNHASNTIVGSQLAQGGAVFNSGNIGDVTSSFTSNTVEAQGHAEGGAVYNATGAKVGNVVGNFVTNTVTKTAVVAPGATDPTEQVIAAGGAIANYGTIGKVSGSGSAAARFEGNKVSSVTGAQGGAIANFGTMGDIKAVSKNNVLAATGGSGDALGGFLFNSGTVGNLQLADESTSSSALVSSKNGIAAGGLVYNTDTGTLGDISLNAGVKNLSISGQSTTGGLLHNSGTINAWKGNSFSVSGTKATALGTTVLGGVIYNTGTVSDGLYNTLVSSTTVSAKSGVSGGALYNSGTIGYVKDVYLAGTTATATAGTVTGAALYNSGTIGDTTGLKFEKNTASATSSANGAAIANVGRLAQIGNIVNASFSANKILTSSETQGGLILNEGRIGNLSASFSDNDASVTGDISGGLIFNSAQETAASIGDITASKIENSDIVSSTGKIFGGLIGNQGTTGAVKANISQTKVTAKNNVIGGLIANEQTMGAVALGAADTTVSGSSVLGGALYNIGTIGALSGQKPSGTDLVSGFNTTSVTATSGSVTGGVIYNTVALSGGVSNVSFNGTTVRALNGAVAGGAFYSGPASASATEEEVQKIAISGFNDVFFKGTDIRAKNNVTGGAFYNLGTLAQGINKGGFSDTSVFSTAGNVTGAAFNNTGTVGALTQVDFVRNTVGDAGAQTAGGLNAYGAGLYNSGTVGAILGSFETNRLTVTNEALGGAIYNIGTIGDVTGDFQSNLLLGTAQTASSAGAAIYNVGSKAVIGAITGDFKNNSVSNGLANGGAVFNTGSIGAMASNFIGNTVSSFASEGSTAGGALYNAGTIAGLSGAEAQEMIVQDNTISSKNKAMGGAIYNIGEITSGITTAQFEKNAAVSSDNEAWGGAYYNGNNSEVSSILETTFANNMASGKLKSGGGAFYNLGVLTDGMTNVTFKYNTVSSQTGVAEGGALHNTGHVGDLVNTVFTENAVTGAQTYGGAIYNTNKMGDLTVSFMSQKMTATQDAFGGNLYNENGTIGALTARTDSTDPIGILFRNTTVKAGTGRVQGGALYSTGTIGDVTGDFYRTVVTAGDFVLGAALYNTGTIGNLTSSFENNTATITGTTASASAGAGIYNTGVMGNVTGDFNTNVISVQEGGQGSASGGAVYNEGQMGLFVSNFENNRVISKASSGLTAGGAVYNTGTITGFTPVVGAASFLVKDNVISALNAAQGGGIYNTGEITDGILSASFERNGIVSSNDKAMGGALYNGALGKIALLSNASFTSNTTNAKQDAAGGAFYNMGHIDGGIAGLTMSLNRLTSGANAFGGAFYNGGTVGDVSGASFSDHVLTAATDGLGGTLYNTGTIGNVAASFDQSSVEAKNGVGAGGTLYNAGEIGDITGSLGETSLTAKKDASGGAIYNSGTLGNLAFADASTVSVSSEEGAVYGGALYSSNAVGSVSWDFKDVIVLAQTDAFGGAVFNTGVMGDLTSGFGQNRVSASGEALGGGLYNTGTVGNVTGFFSQNTVQADKAKGGAVYNTGTLGTLTLSDMSGNTLTSFATSDMTAGGAIYNTGVIAALKSTQGAVFGQNKIVSGNAAHGGFVYNAGEITEGIVDATFDKNAVSSTSAEAFGGAVYNDAGKTIHVLSNASFTENTANGYKETAGGALYNLGVLTEGVTNGLFTANKAVSVSSTAFGGAVYNTGDISVLSAPTFKENAAEGYVSAFGGAVYNTGKILSGLTNASFSANTLTAKTGSALGGAVYNTGTLSDFTAAKFVGNSASGAQSALGGAVYHDSLSAFGFSGTDFEGNAATASIGSASGGALVNKGSLGAWDDMSFTQNSVSAYGEATGGAVYNEGTLALGMTNLDFLRNKTVSKNASARGGAFYNTGTLATGMQNASFEGNTLTAATDGFGGALYSGRPSGSTQTGTIAELDEVNFWTNSVSAGKDGFGGALYYEGDLASGMTNLDFLKNTVSASALAYGGGAALVSADVSLISETRFEANAATGSETFGGALSLDNTQVGTIVGSAFDLNKLEGSQMAAGGAIWLNQNSVIDQIGNTRFSNNAALTDQGAAMGGAIYNDGKITALTGAVFRNNGASADHGNAFGGSIYNSGSLTIGNGSSFSNSSAVALNGIARGGAIYNTGTIDLTGTVSFSGNTVQDSQTLKKVKDDIYNEGDLNFHKGNFSFYSGISGNGTVNVKNQANLNIFYSPVSASKVTFEDGTSLSIRMKGKAAGEYGSIKADKVTIGTNDTVLNLTLNSGVLKHGETTLITVVDSADITGEFAALSENRRYEFKFTDTAGTYQVTGLLNAEDVVAEAGGSIELQKATADIFDNYTYDENSQFYLVLDELDRLSQVVGAEKQLVHAVEALAPEKAPVVTSVSDDLNKHLFMILDDRLERAYVGNRVRGGNRYTREPENKSMLWVEGLYAQSELSSDKAAFEADTTGVALGVDTLVANTVRLGVAYSYAQSDVTNTHRDLSADTHSVMLYGKLNGDRAFVNGALTYSTGSWTEDKMVSNIPVNAEFDVTTVGGWVMGGYRLGGFEKGGVWTPSAGVRVLSITQDEYADSAGQQIKPGDGTLISGVAQIKYDWTWRPSENVKFQPGVRLGATYDFSQPDGDYEVGLPSQSHYRISQETLDKFGFEAGLGIGVKFYNALSINLKYEGAFRKDYTSHAGIASLRYDF